MALTIWNFLQDAERIAHLHSYSYAPQPACWPKHEQAQFARWFQEDAGADGASLFQKLRADVKAAVLVAPQAVALVEEAKAEISALRQALILAAGRFDVIANRAQEGTCESQMAYLGYRDWAEEARAGATP